MSEGTYNVDLLMQVREKIVNEPEKHFQGSWARAESDPREGGDCGTAYCVAGWAAVLDGQELAWDENEGGSYEAAHLLMENEDGCQPSIHQYARDALRLSAPMSGRLFSPENRRSEVLAALDMLIEAGKNGEVVSNEAFRACFEF